MASTIVFKRVTVFIVVCSFLYSVTSQNIDGGWSPWQVDPEIDCCVYGPYGLYKRYCNNPSPEGQGALCLTMNNSLGVIDSEWRTCTCACTPACEPLTQFCANDTGRPAFCQCNYGMIPPYDVDPNAVTKCVSPDSTTAAPPTTKSHTILNSKTKDTLKAIGYASCGFLVVCIALSIILNLITGNIGKDRLIQMCEEATLLIVHLLILFGAEAVSNAGFCKATAVLLHYLFMCTMAFYCLEALHTYSMITYVVPRNGYFPWFVNIIMGFGIPLIPLAFALGFQLSLYGTNNRHCWCDLSTFQSWSFLFPMGFAGFVTMIIAEAQGQGKYHPLPETEAHQFTSARISQNSMMFIMPLSLISYVFGLIAVDIQSVTLYGLFFAVNVILGIVLLFFHTASSSKIRAVTGRLCICFSRCIKDVEGSPENRPNTAKVAPSPSETKKPIPDEEPAPADTPAPAEHGFNNAEERVT